MAAGPGDHSAYLEAGAAAIASVSPELFLRIEGDRCETRPIKGTRRRGATPSEDAALAAALRVVRQGPRRERDDRRPAPQRPRPDLGAGLGAGGGAVRAGAHGERDAPGVVGGGGRCAPTSAIPTCSCRASPAARSRGAPKRRAMEIIDRLEREPRGFYCGSVFSWEPAAQRLIASIAIRTATVHRRPRPLRRRRRRHAAVRRRRGGRGDDGQGAPVPAGRERDGGGLVTRAVFETMLDRGRPRAPARAPPRAPRRAGVPEPLVAEVRPRCWRSPRGDGGVPVVVRIDVVGRRDRGPAARAAAGVGRVGRAGRGLRPGRPRRASRSASSAPGRTPPRRRRAARRCSCRPDGLVGETTRANVFAILGGTVVTPAVGGHPAGRDAVVGARAHWR